MSDFCFKMHPVWHKLCFQLQLCLAILPHLFLFFGLFHYGFVFAVLLIVNLPDSNQNYEIISQNCKLFRANFFRTYFL